MFKQRMTKIMVALTLPVAVAGSASIVAYSLADSVTSPAQVYSSGGSSGGGC